MTFATENDRWLTITALQTAAERAANRRAELSSLVEYIRAECAHRGIYLSEGKP